METVVIYHGNCTDGFCSAYLARMAIPDAAFFPAQYNNLENIPDVRGKQVFILDFSYPKKVLLLMQELANSLVVLDHHKTAQEDLQDLDFCIFDLNRSGASLTKDFFFPDISYDFWLVDYIEDRDLWLHKLPNTHEINAAIFSYPYDFASWDLLWTKSPEDLVNEGTAILRFQAKIVEAAVTNSQEITLQGHRVLVANSHTMQSDIAGILATDRPFGVVWSQKADGRIKYSLRSTPGIGIDVAKIAQLYGGGGHKHAAGFVTNSLIHFSMLKLTR